jgi:hypothetical protein
MTSRRSSSTAFVFDLDPWCQPLPAKKLRLRLPNGSQLNIDPVNRFDALTIFDHPPKDLSQEQAMTALSPRLKKRYAACLRQAQQDTEKGFGAAFWSAFGFEDFDNSGQPLASPEELAEIVDAMNAALFGPEPEVVLLQFLHKMYRRSLDRAQDDTVLEAIFEKQNIDYENIIFTVTHNRTRAQESCGTQHRNASLPRSEIDIEEMSDLMESGKRKGIPNLETARQHLRKLEKDGRTDLPMPKTLVNRVATYRRKKRAQ